MGKELKNIENLFKSSFEDYRVEPSEKVWKNISFKLKLYKYISPQLFNNLIYSTVIIATIAIISIFLYNIFEEQKVNLADKLSSNSNYIISQSDKENQLTDVQTIENTISETSKKIQINNKSESSLLSNLENERTEDLAPVIVSKSIKVLSNNLDSFNKFNVKSTPPPMPIFTIKSKEGCTPFELELENLSKSALAFEWNFGNGHRSTEVSPRYTYRYPGVYKVVLKAVGFGGVAVSYTIDSIVVHDPPVARLYWPYKSVIQTGQKIIIQNESENITETVWNFGDKSFSDELDGEHVFNKEGEYSIVLKVWTENGCMDSTIIENIKVVNTNGKIVLPNAFTPNTEGPSSGYYNKVDYHNNIFFPIVNAKIESFEIRIFSKAGIQVFKSIDILYGWNGYYQNRLLPQGVYLYIVSGEFEGGQKFYEKGNVTILHRK